jgi:hypothetical protein
MFTLNGQRIPYDKAWTHPDTGVQYPANWMRLATLEEKEAIGLVEEADPAIAVWDQRFYWGVDNPKQLEDVTDDDGNVSTGLKTLWKNKQNEIAASLLAPSDWRVVKELEVNSSFSAAKTALSADWRTYRAAVRTACNTRQGEIDACADVGALKDLLFGEPATVTAWPDPIDQD